MHDPYETIDLASEVAMFWWKWRVPPWLRRCRPAGTSLTCGLPHLPPGGPVRRQPHAAVGRRPIDDDRIGPGARLQGFDVDLLPHGQPVTAEELADASMVLLLPTLDYAGPRG